MERSTFAKALLVFCDEAIDFDQARFEWRLRLAVDGDRFECLCGRSAKGLGCLAEHLRTGRLVRIGSCCAFKHFGWDARGLASDLESLSRNPCHPMSEALASFCQSVGWISQWEFDFCGSTGLVSMPSAEQRSKRVEINVKAAAGARRDAATASALPPSAPPKVGPILFG
jgi:hypothetical protein